MSVRTHLRLAAPIHLLATLAALCGPAHAAAQEPVDTFSLSELVVTATRVPLPRAAVPAAVTVLHGDDLRERGVRLVGDALRDVPGATLVRTGSEGGITSLFLRGGESDYVQVLVDGVVVNDPGGSVDLGQLTLDDVERIEIVRGPVSVLYGSEAVTGVINIITKRGAGRPRLRVSANAGRAERQNGDASVCPGYPAKPCPANAELGAYTTRGAEASASGAAGALRWSAGGSAYHSGGAYAFNNAYRNGALAGQVAFEQAGTEVMLSTRWTDGLYHYPTDGSGRLVDQNAFRSSKSLVLGLDAGRIVAPHVELRGALSLRHGDDASVDDKDSPGDTLGVYSSTSTSVVDRRKADVFANLRAAHSVATFGVELEHQHGTSGYDSRSEYGPYGSSTDDERSNRALYGQLVLSPTGRVTATGGVRRESNDRFGSYVTWRAGATLRATRVTTLRAAAGTAFKEPTFFENYATGYTVGNPALQPERSRSWEVGLEQRLPLSFGDASFSATWFDQRFRNLIQYTGTPKPRQSNYVNIGEASSRGLELEGRAALARGLGVTASWVHLLTDVIDEGFGTDGQFQAGQPLIRRPRERVNVSAEGPLTRRARLGADVRYVGARDDLDFLTDYNGVRVILPAYTTADAFAELALSGRIDDPSERDLRLRVRVDNLLDRRYEEVAHFPSPGRALSVALTAAAGL